MKKIKQIFLLGLIVIGAIFIMLNINEVAKPQRMTHAMEILDNGAFAFLKVIFGLILLLLGNWFSKESLLSYFYWALSAVISLFVVKNFWFYSEVPYLTEKLYPSTEIHLFGFTLVLLFLFLGWRKGKHKKGDK